MYDKWYQTDYSMTKLPEDFMTKLKSVNLEFTKKKLDLPPPNTLLPTNFEILPEDPDNSKVPILIQELDDTDLWYKKDDKFKKPKAFV